MATANISSDFGPYYTGSLRKQESQRKAITGQGFTPEELASLSYGELAARYKDAEARRTQAQNFAIQQGQLNLGQEQINLGQQRIGLEALAGRRAARAQSSQELGAAVSGIANIANIADKLGFISPMKKAVSGLISPERIVSAEGGMTVGGGMGEYAYQPTVETAGVLGDLGQYDISGFSPDMSGYLSELNTAFDAMFSI